jgi:hypothetical protein
MSIELTFVGFQDGIPIYMPINKKDQEALKGHSVIECAPKKKGTRTNKQNSALHLFLRKLADALNDAGLDMKAVLKPEVEIPWSDSAAKEYLWKPVQKAMLGKESTKELETDEVSKVYDTLNRHLASKFGVSVPFPEIYQLIYEQDEKNT